MLLEILGLLPLSLSNALSLPQKDIENDFIKNSNSSFSYINKSSVYDVSLGRSIFYYESEEQNTFPETFNESYLSYSISISNINVLIYKNNLDVIHINDKYIAYHNSPKTSIDNYEICDSLIKRFDYFGTYSDLEKYSIESTYSNLTIEIYDANGELLFINDYRSFSSKKFMNEIKKKDCCYPLSIITTIDYSFSFDNHENRTTEIREKYFEVGQSNCVCNSTYLKVGKSNLALLDYLGNFYYPVYKSVFEITLPVFSDSVSHYINISLNIRQFSGSLNSLKVYKVNNLSFDEINGNSSYSSSYIGLFTKTNDKYSLDYRFISSGINSSNNTLVLILESSTQSANTAELCSSLSSNPPLLIKEHHSIFGNAGAYNYVNNTNINCYGYALDKTIGIQNINGWYSSNPLPNNPLEYVSNIIINDIETNHSYNCRRLDSFNSYIDANERRIAMRFSGYSSNTFGVFHFIKECSDGRWAEKHATNPSIVFQSGDNPETINSGTWPLYNCPPLYFAISTTI